MKSLFQAITVLGTLASILSWIGLTVFQPAAVIGVNLQPIPVVIPVPSSDFLSSLQSLTPGWLVSVLRVLVVLYFCAIVPYLLLNKYMLATFSEEALLSDSWATASTYIVLGPAVFIEVIRLIPNGGELMPFGWELVAGFVACPCVTSYIYGRKLRQRG